MKKAITILSGIILISCWGQTNNTITNQDSSLQVIVKVLNQTEINITVKNIGKHLIKAYSYVKAENNQYDYFEIEAITPDHEQMIFVFYYTNRIKAAPVIVALKPNEYFSHTIDLVQWIEQSNYNTATLKKVGLNYLPHGIKIRAKYLNNECTNCNDYYKSIWTGYIYSDWVEF